MDDKIDAFDEVTTVLCCRCAFGNNTMGMLMIVVKLFICDYCYFRLAWIHIQRRWDVSSEIWGQSLKGLGTTFK